MKVIATAQLSAESFSAELEGKDCGDPGLSLILVDAGPGQGPALHRHSYAEVMVVLEGTATFSDGVDSREVAAGNVVVVLADEPHAFTNRSDKPLRQIDIHVSNSFVTEWM